MHRRHFLALGATALGWAQAARAVRAQEIPWGETRLGISDDGRDGTLYVPKTYEDGKPAPLVIMLHGLGGVATRFAFPLAEELGIVVISPESREITWGQAAPGFDEDVKYIGAAFRKVTALLDIDSTRVALGGVSDGATYALSMGLAYGDTFNHLMIFAAGIPAPLRKRGKPKIFVGHGTEDHQMPIDDTARNWGPKLKAEGYNIIIREHPGGHGAPQPIVREAFEWLVADK
jgi:phospholipase/carboxylesterase